VTIHITLAGVWSVGKYVIVYGAGVGTGLWIGARAFLAGFGQAF
jgi:hypothetical protein